MKAPPARSPSPIFGGQRQRELDQLPVKKREPQLDTVPGGYQLLQITAVAVRPQVISCQ